MFEIGEYVHYSAAGVCQVAAITTMDLGGGEKPYYELHPIYEPGRIIYTAVGTEAPRMRHVLTREEASQLIREIPQIKGLWVPEEKTRETQYKDALKTGECTNWIKIIKTVYVRRRERESGGKRITATDERYLKMAEDKLYGELALALDMQKNDMESYITSEIAKIQLPTAN